MNGISFDMLLDQREETPLLKCIFYAEFDSRVGPRIVHQIPDDAPSHMISKETFDSLSGYFITKPELLDKFIKVNTPKLKIMGHPVVIENKKYERNAFIFNLCFVVDNVSHVDCLYEPIVCKMARYLINLEIDCQYLSKEQTKNQFKEIMRQIYLDLNSRKECAVTVNDKTCIHLKIMPKVYPPPEKSVSPYDAPVLRRKYDENELNRLDVVSQKCVPHFTGFSPISQISDIVQIDKVVVCRCVENLRYHGLVDVLPLFLYTNSYTISSNVKKLYQSCQEFKQNFCTSVALQISSTIPPPKFCDIFRLLCRIQPSLSMRDWCLRHNPRAYNIDERKLIQLAVYNGFVKKLTIYPASIDAKRYSTSAKNTNNTTNITTTTTNNNEQTNNNSNGYYYEDDAATTTMVDSSASTTTVTAASNILDGSRTLEELAHSWGQKPSETCQRLENNADIVLLYK
uniref:Nitrogen permease regulator 2-like protein n=1 Tax=Romanomermis culicivorax TaxID=13658 RepID=A0A915KJN8_ROMCU